MAARLRVLHVINTLAAGGAELHLLTLCRRLIRHHVEVMVACLRDEVEGIRGLRPDFERAGITVVHLQGGRTLGAQSIVRLARLLGRERPDIVHTHLPRADFAMAVARLAHPRLPWLSSVHAVYGRYWRGRWSLPLFNVVWRRADRVIAISHAVEQWLVGLRKVPADRIRVVYYGIEAEGFLPRLGGRGLGGPAGDGYVIGSLGRLEPVKGHETLIRAMPIVLEQAGNARLVIGGHDAYGYGASLEALIRANGLEARVQLMGFQNDVPGFLDTLDVFAFASRSEGFGQVIIEAMAMGKPVVASRIAPLSEIVVEGETGLLVPTDEPRAFGEAISWCLTHREEALSMGAAGRRRVEEEFSAETMARRTIEVYEELLEGRTAVR